MIDNIAENFLKSVNDFQPFFAFNSTRNFQQWLTVVYCKCFVCCYFVQWRFFFVKTPCKVVEEPIYEFYSRYNNVQEVAGYYLKTCKK